MSAKMKWIQNIAAFGIFAALILYILFHTTDNPRYHLILDERGMLLEALWNTLYISLISLVLCMAAGFLFYLLLNSRIQLIKAIAVIFREIIMGTPMLVMVFLMVYVFGNLIGVSDKVVLGITALTVCDRQRPVCCDGALSFQRRAEISLCHFSADSKAHASGSH